MSAAAFPLIPAHPAKGEGDKNPYPHSFPARRLRSAFKHKASSAERGIIKASTPLFLRASSGFASGCRPNLHSIPGEKANAVALVLRKRIHGTKKETQM